MKGLFFKLYALVAIPSIGIFLVGVNNFLNYYKSYNETQTVLKTIPFLVSSSTLLSGMQVERGLSATLLSGGQVKEQLSAHREKTDQMSSVFLELLKSSSIDENYLSNIRSHLLEVPSLREKIDNQNYSKVQAIESYTKIVSLLLSINTRMELNLRDVEILTHLKNLTILEAAKESGGKLRANMSSILASNRPIDTQSLRKLFSLMAGLNEGVHSNLLRLDSEGKNKIEEFLVSEEYKKVDEVFFNIVEQKDNGNFAITASDFFPIISSALAKIKNVVDHSHQSMKKYIEGEYSRKKIILYIILLSSISIISALFFFAYQFIWKLIADFRVSLHSLNNKTLIISGVSGVLGKHSRNVAEKSKQQASSLQGTSSAVHQVNEIISNSVQTTNHSKIKTDKSVEIVKKGKMIVREMIVSIDDISSSSSELVAQVKSNNDEFEKITNIIGEISDKTGVINDIVFQTKLLSFNASVEAARAGEHGKGFAVVAEEVGTLAALSGKASHEISELITSSNKVVHEIVESLRSRIDNFILENEKKLKIGVKNAGECQAIFEEIYNEVNDISSLMDNLNAASHEQASALKEISHSVGELDEATQKNSQTSEKAFEISQKIKSNTTDLQKTVDHLCTIIRGERIKSKKVEFSSQEDEHDDFSAAS